jgi:hypothetical protein
MKTFPSLLCLAIAVCAPAVVLRAADDPPLTTLTSSSYFGGAGFDEANAVVVDADGFVYVAGRSDSLSATGVDGFVVKLTPDGSQVVYSTPIGGSGFDVATALALDASGNVWVVGQTTSADFPVVGGFQSELHGDSDMWIAKLGATGALAFSTYYGGSSFENGKAIAVGPTGTVYVAGDTSSSDLVFPFAPSAIQHTFAGGPSDAFVVRLKDDISGVDFGTYWGGSGEDTVSSLVVDASNNPYIAGATSSLDFVRVFPLQDVYGGGSSDGYITKLIPDLSHPSVSTFIGGFDSDAVASLALDGTGEIYATGWTTSFDFPTLNAYKPFHSNGLSDAFLVKIRADGRTRIFSTFFGGDGFNAAEKVVVDHDGNAHMSGQTDASTFPLVGAVQDAVKGLDAFYAKFSSDGQTLLRSTPLGGTTFDLSHGLALNHTGDVWLVGATDSADFPVVTPFQPSLGGSSDAFVSRLTLADPPPANRPPVAAAGSDQVVFTSGCATTVVLDGSQSSDPDGDPLTFTWTGDLFTATGPSASVNLLPGNYTFTLTVTDGRGGSATDTVNVTVSDNVGPEITEIGATPSVLGPPNHQMIDVSVSVSLADSCDSATVCRIVDVRSNESANGAGDGDTEIDWEVTGALSLRLRAERGHNTEGRIYSITVACVDAAGNTSQRVVTVTVPR